MTNPMLNAYRCPALPHANASVNGSTQSVLRQGVMMGGMNRRATLWATVQGWVKRAWAVHTQRRALRRLSARQLADVGLSIDQARREAARPFWDMPNT